jgi:hypothetical protein
VPRPRRPAHDEAKPQRSALDRQGGLEDTSDHTDSGVSCSPEQRCLVVPSRGDYKSPKSVLKENLSINHPPPTHDLPEPEQPEENPVVEEAHAVLDRVNAAAPRSRMGRHQLAQLTPVVAAVLQDGVWTPAALVEHLVANLAGIKSMYSVTSYRLNDLPDAPPAGAPDRPARPPWCGICDERTRIRETVEEGKPYHCPACHPLSSAQRHQEEAIAAPA